MTAYRVSKSLEERDEVNRDLYTIEGYSQVKDNGELNQAVEYVSITTYELIKKRTKNYSDETFDKKHKGHARIPVSALKFIVGCE